MPEEPSTETFLERLTASGLVDENQIDPLLCHFPRQTSTAAGLASLMVTRRLLTQWQAQKLLAGRHNGFRLGPYTLQSFLARGGMSTLYIARHGPTGALHALKVLPPAKAEQASYLPRFLREARLASQLRHEHVMRVYGLHKHADYLPGQTIYFMAMELLQGHDVFQHVTAGGPASVSVAADIVRQAAEGLQHAHDKGLVHRDVKPGNLFLADGATVKVLDLGLAAALEDRPENLTRMHGERVLGTADYLAPEQAIDSHRIDARADIYALGCTFYFLLSGRPPFTDGTLAQRILAHQTREPQSVCTFRSDVPPVVQSVLSAMLKKRRTARIQTCREVADQLADWLANEGMRPEFAAPAAMLKPSELTARRLQKITRDSSSTDSPTNAQTTSDADTRTSNGSDFPSPQTDVPPADSTAPGHGN